MLTLAANNGNVVEFRQNPECGIRTPLFQKASTRHKSAFFVASMVGRMGPFIRAVPFDGSSNPIRPAAKRLEPPAVGLTNQKEAVMPANATNPPALNISTTRATVLLLQAIERAADRINVSKDDALASIAHCLDMGLAPFPRKLMLTPQLEQRAAEIAAQFTPPIENEYQNWKQKGVTMHALIKIEDRQINEDTTKAVDARELHRFLESKRQFANWISNIIEQYGFTEGEDFLTKLLKTSKGGRPSKEYYISLDMGKEIGMIDRSPKGRQIRKYFIECEKRLKSGQVGIPQSMPEALRLAADLSEKLDVAQPKAAAYDRIENAEGLFCLRDSAKLLSQPPMKFNMHLAGKHYIYKSNGHWNAYSAKIQDGWLDHKSYRYTNSEGYECIRDQVMITPKGLAAIAKQLGVDLPDNGSAA